MDISKYTDVVIVYAGEYGLKIVAALAIFFIGKWGVKKFTTLTKKLMLKAELDLTLVEFLENVIYFALLIVIVLASLCLVLHLWLSVWHLKILYQILAQHCSLSSLDLLGLEIL
jgi:magnesium-transporting ATPase (P-type)